jgi:asparagine synthase (glutamine-hydrolysing)
MSGIAGILNLDGRPADPELLGQMSLAVAHRGPDETLRWTQGPVGFAHCQLRTTPESLGEHQPLTLEDGRYAITCDGRVDNRPELIAALRDQAPVSDATTDAELLLRAYRRWGDRCLEHVVGDFAFAIWDAPRRQLFCARDVMGIRPFYYYRDDHRFLFASDIRALWAAAGVPRQLNPLMLGLYLLDKRGETEQTFFEKILQVPPAHWLTVGASGFQKEWYWEPQPWRQIRYSTTEEYVEHFRHLFFQAVACRLRSTTPVGIALSGGMDSSSITCTGAHLMENGLAPRVEVQTFSSVFNDFPNVDESVLIQAVVEATGVRSHYIQADQLWGFKPLENQAMPWNQPWPAPFQASLEAIQCRAQGEGLRVLLTGEGGDEMLVPSFGFLLDMLRGLRLAPLTQEVRRLTPQSRAAFYREARWALFPDSVRRTYGRWRSGPRPVPGHLSSQKLQQSGALDYQPLSAARHRCAGKHCQHTYQGLVNMPKGPFMPRLTDTYASHHLEVRHPFYDVRLMDFLGRVPPQLKFSRGWTKYLLRKAMAGILPDQVRLRSSKTVFDDMYTQGLRQEGPRFSLLATEGYLVRQGWVNPQELQACYARTLAGERALAPRLTTFITLEDWLRNQFDSNGCGVPQGTHPAASNH